MRQALLGVSLSVVLGVSHAHASDKERLRAKLELVADEGTESCMTKRELEVAVERRLRRKVFVEPAELDVKVRFARGDTTWKAELALFDAQGRELGRRALDTEAKDCSALDASLALVVALLVDSPPEPPPPPPPEMPIPAEKQVPPPSRTTSIQVPKETYAPREPWRFVPTLSISGAYDRLPGFAFGPRAGVTFLPPHFPEFRLSVGALLPSEKTHESGEYGARFWLVDALFELCPLGHSSPSVRISGCLGQSVGRLSVSGFGFDENDEEPGVDLVVTAGASAWFLVARPFGVFIGLGAGFPLSRNSYSARTAEGERIEVWQRGYVVGTGEAGVGLEL
jgi:hypothetical protein